MTAERLWVAIGLFHAGVAGLLVLFERRWRPHRCGTSMRRWWMALSSEALALALLVYLTSLLATLVANRTWPGRIHLGPISLRLLGQALFIEGPLLCLVLAWRHRVVHRHARAASLAAGGLLLAVVHVDAYYIEPRMLVPRHYEVGRPSGGPGSPSIRILHLSDIQTPRIGAHEEEALRLGLSFQPDLIVLTGDYVQDALGEPTELQAAADLRRLIARLGFTARLGVFATEGDVGPPCAVVFAGVAVRCLTDQSARVDLPGGGSLSVTGLTRGRGRERDPRVLGRLLAAAPEADHRIVISHAPDFISAMPVNVDLALAGHTHGGQVVIPFFGPPRTAIRLPRRYAGGLNDYRGTPIHVSRGVGMERGFDIPIRFLCPPEIGIIDLVLPKRGRGAPL